MLQVTHFQMAAYTRDSVESSSSAALGAAYSYDITLTPNITAISPEFGSAAGGTVVTITGINLHDVAAEVLVLIDGVACSVLTANLVSITCTTGQRPSISANTFEVITPAGRAVTNDLAFVYMDR